MNADERGSKQEFNLRSSAFICGSSLLEMNLYLFPRAARLCSRMRNDRGWRCEKSGFLRARALRAAAPKRAIRELCQFPAARVARGRGMFPNCIVVVGCMACF